MGRPGRRRRARDRGRKGLTLPDLTTEEAREFVADTLQMVAERRDRLAESYRRIAEQQRDINRQLDHVELRAYRLRDMLNEETN